jgi:chromopyrrolic acid synthase
MSVFDFPRLHFQGSARIHAPTGHKSGMVDFNSNTVYMDGYPYDYVRPASDYHHYLDKLGPRFNAEGQWDENGLFSMAKGCDFGGNSHFAIDARISSVQRQPFEIDLDDFVVGRSVDMWGHYNEYLATTFNRARVFDCDPASNWTNTIMVGQFTFGRQGRSHEIPNMLSAPVEGLQPARWQNFDHIRALPEHCLNSEFKRASVHQFTVDKSADAFVWGEESMLSPTVSLLCDAMKREDVLGLVVQFGLRNMSTPTQPDSPVFWELHGTIGLWCSEEMSTYPHGRLLTPRLYPQKTDQSVPKTLSNLTVKITSQCASLNFITAVPCIGRAAKPEKGPIHHINGKLDIGNLELRTTKSHKLIATIPKISYQQDMHKLNSGIIDVPLAEPFDHLFNIIEQEGLYIIGIQSDGQNKILAQENEINIQVDEACIFLEFPNYKHNDDRAITLQVRSFVRGHACALEKIYLRQFYNPKALPHLRYEFERSFANTGKTFHYPSSVELPIVEFKPGRPTESGTFHSQCCISTDKYGCGWLTLRGVYSGTTRVLLSVQSDDTPWDSSNPDEAELAYDNNDELGFWSGSGSFAVRVLPNDWHLEEIPDENVDFDLVYQHVFAYYELLFSFMKAEVFSLADHCRVATCSRLVWQMSDPRNKNKTYYMPPTRDMSEPKATLLLKFLNNQQRLGYVPSLKPIPKRPQCKLQTRNELVAALRHAAQLEVAVMLQYIYAAYSIPNYVTGQEYVKQGVWTQEQLQLACGDGEEVHNHGMRGILLEISHEEMIHFLMVNNILMAMGEPFYPAIPNFSELNHLFPIEVDFALEPLNLLSLQRFMCFEWPDFLNEELNNDSVSNPSSKDHLHGYGSISELYRQIRDAIKTIPDLIVVEKYHTGGDHHLFLREDLNIAHPDYQLQVDDVESALFAIDFIVEQGEGNNLESKKFEQSHFRQFQRMAEALAQQKSSNNLLPWIPSYPALRNPSIIPINGYSTNIVTVPETIEVMRICNECYFLMMQLMVQHFGLMPYSSLRRSKIMNAALDVMAGMIRPLGELLMTLPSGKRGKTSGPAFSVENSPHYIESSTVAYRSISSQFERLSIEARQCEIIPRFVCELMEFYVNFFEDLLKDPMYKST